MALPLSRVLQMGLGVSLFLVFVSLVVYFAEGAPAPLAPQPMRNLLGDLGHPSVGWFLNLGILLLLLTPLARVLTSALLFLRRRDVIFTAVTAIVLANLVLGLLLGNL